MSDSGEERQAVPKLSLASSIAPRYRGTTVSVDASPTKSRESYRHMARQVLFNKHSSKGMDAWSAGRFRIHQILESPWYSVLMGVVIVLNTVLVIREVDVRAAEASMPGWVSVASDVFLIIYFMEITIRIYTYRLDFFTGAWNWLDFLVVITDCCAEAASAVGLDELPSVSVLRVFRLMRLIRLVAILAVFEELQTMLLGFASAMKAMMWASMMIAFVLTVCSIIAVVCIHPLNVEVAKTGAYGECERCGRAFETVAQANLTFLQQIIAGDSWGLITIPIIEAHPAAGAFLLLVFGIVDLGVVNLVLMVIVNAAEAARQANEEIKFQSKIRAIEDFKYMLSDIFHEVDKDTDGNISLAEFLEGIDTNEELARIMAGLDIQRQDAEMIHAAMDHDESGGVDFNEFIDLLVATKHESLDTKVLWLRCGLEQVRHGLENQKKILKRDILPNISTRQIDKAVGAATAQAFAKMWDKINGSLAEQIDQFGMQLQMDPLRSKVNESLIEKLEGRWDQLQMDQTRSFLMHEKVIREMLLPLSKGSTGRIQSEAQAGAHEYSLLSLPKPSSGVPCNVSEGSATQTAPSDFRSRITCEKSFDVRDLGSEGNAANLTPANVTDQIARDKSFDVPDAAPPVPHINVKLYKTRSCAS